MILARFGLPLAFAVTVLAGTGLLAYRSTSHLLEAGRSLEQTHRVLGGLEVLVARLEDAETAARRYAVTGKPEYLELHEAARASVAPVVRELRALTQDDPELLRKLEALDSRIAAEVPGGDGKVSARSDQGLASAVALFQPEEGPPIVDDVRAGLGELAAVEATILGRRRAEATALGQRTVATICAGTLLGIGLLLSVSFLLHREKTKRMRAETAILTSEERTRLLIEAAQARLRERGMQLEAAHTELDTFSHSVSHDFRAPLRAIDGFARMLVEEHAPSLDTEARRLLGVICDNAVVMGRLIDGLLKFSRLGRKEMETSAIDMATLARIIVSEAHAHEPSRSVTVTISPLAPAFGDLAMVRQVLVNLVANAFKFTRARPNPVIEIGSTRSGGEQIYFVKDNGAGFDMEHVGKLFHVFQRLHRATDFEGTGVGLALVRRIVARHGGRVWAEGRPDGGAVFSFSLPAGAPDADAARR